MRMLLHDTLRRQTEDLKVPVSIPGLGSYMMICKAEGQTHLGAVSMLCENVGVQLLGSEKELRTLLSTVLLWDVKVAG